MVIPYILTGLTQFIWLDEYTDETQGVTFSEGYYMFTDPGTSVLNISSIETTEGNN